MFFRTARSLAICSSMAAVLLASPAQSRAGCLDWLFGGCCGRSACYPAYTTYRPLFGGCCATACNPCTTAACNPCNPCPTQTCSYVPQTCYRAECVNVPVTTYQPVTSCDPCTGCPVTCMRPVTSVVRQVRYVPHTTYRQVCTTSYAPAAPVAASFYSPSVAAPSCCTPAPAVSAPSTFAVPNGGTVIQSAPAVSTPAPASAAPPQTYDENTAPSLNGASQRTYDSSLRAVPDNNVNRSPNGGFRPLFKQPESRTTGLQDRTASLNSGDATAGRTTGAASNTVQAVYSQPASVQIDDGGWRAARR